MYDSCTPVPPYRPPPGNDSLRLCAAPGTRACANDTLSERASAQPERGISGCNNIDSRSTDNRTSPGHALNQQPPSRVSLEQGGTSPGAQPVAAVLHASSATRPPPVGTSQRPCCLAHTASLLGGDVSPRSSAFFTNPPCPLANPRPTCTGRGRMPTLHRCPNPPLRTPALPCNGSF